MQNKPYTTEARNVVFTPDVLIHATFKGSKSYAGELAGLREWAITNEVDAPLSCFTDLGRHGLFPCLVATNEKIATGLSVMMGTHIEQNNGATFASRLQMRGVAVALSRAGIRLDRESFQWGITELPYADGVKAAQPKQMTMDEALELQLADGPF